MSLRVLVTGGGDSVGREIAEQCHARGDRVFICDVRQAAVDDTLSANPGMQGAVADVGDGARLQAMVDEAMSRLEGVDVLVNNVGIGGPRAAIEDISDEDWARTLDVNVTAAFRLMRAVTPGMKARRSGLIVNFSTGSTRTRLPMRTPYVVSKFAIEGLTLNAARELGPHNIRCNAILPGMINNARMRGIVAANAAATGRSEAEIEDDYLRYISLHTKIEPEELAASVLFLASPAGAKITGELIAVSGNVEWEI